MERRTKDILTCECEAVLCSDRITCGGEEFVPDATRAYMDCRISHSFPVVLAWGSALHPQVIANSYPSMLHKKVDISHLVKSFDPENITRDRIVGCVVAAEFPDAPFGGWKVPDSVQSAPAIRAVMAVFKQAEGVDRILGQHQSGKHTWTVSQEFNHARSEGCFLTTASGGDTGSTPEDLQALGWTMIPYADAPEDLIATLPNRPGKAMKTWKKNGRDIETIFLCGGLDGEVHYEGIGIVQYGAEPTAEISKVLAGSAPSVELERFLVGSKHLLQFTRQLLDAPSLKCAGRSTRPAQGS